MERKLIPLDQMIEYVEFRRPGPHRVLGVIVWPDYDSNVLELKKYFLQEYSAYNYRHRVLDYDTKQFFLHGSNLRYLPETAELAVVVADKLFPKEPPAWEQRWVNFWFETEAKDPCHTIRRRFLAYSIQPIAVPLWIGISVASRFLTALGAVLLLGMRGVDFGAILHPFRDDFKDVYFDANSIFFWDKEGKERPTAYGAFIPIIPLLVFSALFLSPLTINFIWKAFVTLILVGGVSAFFYMFLDRSQSEEKRRLRKEWEEQEQKAAEEKMNEALQLIACENTTPSATLGALPKSHQTLYLRFKDIKAKRCRPYAVK